MIQIMISDLVTREGGFVDHPLDRGGATNMGVTLETLTNWREAPCTVEDVKALSYEEASDIYWQIYWEAPKFHELGVHAVIEEMLFDAAVHHGPGRSVKLLQKAAGITVDGLIGPNTVASVRDISPVRLSSRLIGARVAFIGQIITKRPEQAVFASGWAARMEEFISKIAEI